MKKCSEKKTYNILYIEDDEDDFLFLKRELSNSKRAKFTIDLASDIEEVFSKDLFNYDLFIVDYCLPSIDGISLMENMKKNHKIDSPFIIFTGMGDESIDQRAVDAGAYDYLIKGSIDQQILERTIIYCHEKWKLIKSLESKNIFLEMVLDSINSSVFLLDKNGKIVIANKKSKETFNEDMVGSYFDEKINFYPFTENMFDIKTKEKISISKKMDEIKQFPVIQHGIIKLYNEFSLSSIINMNLIKKNEKYYKMISIIDNSLDHKEKEILIKENKKLEGDLKKYGLEKRKPGPIVDLVQNELNRFFDLEEKNGSF